MLASDLDLEVVFDNASPVEAGELLTLFTELSDSAVNDNIVLRTTNCHMW